MGFPGFVCTTWTFNSEVEVYACRVSHYCRTLFANSWDKLCYSNVCSEEGCWKCLGCGIHPIRGSVNLVQKRATPFYFLFFFLKDKGRFPRYPFFRFGSIYSERCNRMYMYQHLYTSWRNCSEPSRIIFSWSSYGSTQWNCYLKENKQKTMVKCTLNMFFIL